MKVRVLTSEYSMFFCKKSHQRRKDSLFNIHQATKKCIFWDVVKIVHVYPTRLDRILVLDSTLS